MVGNLSNVLPADEGTPHSVICTKRLTDIRFKKDGVYVSAGVTSGALLRYMQTMGLSGTEFLAGIPCTLGGILYMNGGVNGQYIATLVQSVRVIRKGEVVDLPINECGYSYKNSIFMQTDDFILGATLHLENDDGGTIKDKIQHYMQKRAHLPKGKSMGCVFKNPPDISAGALIEQVGLKGFRVGGAKVSELHANFIINDQHATAADIRTLIELIKNAVYKAYGMMLEEEIRYI